jgi:hypothetical protein
MFIHADMPVGRYIRVFHDQEELHTCVWFDTEIREAMCFIINAGMKIYLTKVGNITFKLERDKNIPEPLFTELTTDKCFAGFID